MNMRDLVRHLDKISDRKLAEIAQYITDHDCINACEYKSLVLNFDICDELMRVCVMEEATKRFYQKIFSNPAESSIPLSKDKKDILVVFSKRVDDELVISDHILYSKNEPKTTNDFLNVEKELNEMFGYSITILSWRCLEREGQ